MVLEFSSSCGFEETIRVVGLVVVVIISSFVIVIVIIVIASIVGIVSIPSTTTLSSSSVVVVVVVASSLGRQESGGAQRTCRQSRTLYCRIRPHRLFGLFGKQDDLPWNVPLRVVLL